MRRFYQKSPCFILNKDNGDEKMESQGVRINKFLSEAGVCSRREADRQIEQGTVKIDDRLQWLVTGFLKDRW